MALITTRETSGSSNGTGSITCTTSSNTVTGSGTLFTSEANIGQALFNASGTYIGTINVINSNTTLTLNFSAAVAVTGGSFTVGSNSITVKSLPLSNAEIDANFIQLNNNKLDTTYVGSSRLVTLGNVTTGTWNATTIATNKGGTNLTSFNTNGALYATNSSTLTTGTLPIAAGGTGLSAAPAQYQILMGDASGGYTQYYLLGTANRISYTVSGGAITLTTPQAMDSSANVQFNALGIGTTPPAVAGGLTVNTSLGVGTSASSNAGEIRATYIITSYYSDERLKENIQTIENALDKVKSIRGVTYNANELAESFGYKNKESQVGVLAGDVEKVLPEAVKPAPFDILQLQEGIEISRSGENYKTVQYEKLVPLLIQAVKELSEEVDRLKNK